MLEVNGIAPDKRFYLYVKGARKEVQELPESPRGYRISSGFMSSLLYATTRVVLLRKQGKEEKERVKQLTMEILERAIRGQKHGSIIVLDRQAKRSRKFDEDGFKEPWMEDNEDLRAALRKSPPDMFGVSPQ